MRTSSYRCACGRGLYASVGEEVAQQCSRMRASVRVHAWLQVQGPLTMRFWNALYFCFKRSRGLAPLQPENKIRRVPSGGVLEHGSSKCKLEGPGRSFSTCNGMVAWLLRGLMVLKYGCPRQYGCVDEVLPMYGCLVLTCSAHPGTLHPLQGSCRAAHSRLHMPHRIGQNPGRCSFPAGGRCAQ